MKIYGSNLPDTLIGTGSADIIRALGGDDLIFTAGGRDVIDAGIGDDLIAGFAFNMNNVLKSPYRNAQVDGGAGSHDVMIVELQAKKGQNEVELIFESIGVKRVEEFIYNFANVSSKQKIMGSDQKSGYETIVVGSGQARIEAGAGDDFIFTAAGDDVVAGGAGVDFIHAGEGHNSISGGSGRDFFHFQLTDKYQYTEITDFKAGQDQILISVDTAQVNLYQGFFDDEWEDVDAPGAIRGYGDMHYGIGPKLNDYVSYNNGRLFDASQFSSADALLPFDEWAYYEKSTGSVFALYYEVIDDVLYTQEVLVAHVKPGTDIDTSDFLFERI